MPPNESITYITHNFKINLFKSFTIDSIIEFMMPDITATFGDFSTDKIKEKLGKPVINCRTAN